MYRRIISWLLVILWMVVIYGFSSEPGKASGERSEYITRKIQKLIDTTPVKGKIKWTDFATRKLAHVTEYLILTLLICNAFAYSGVHGWKMLILAVVISTAYAAMDEYHQSFTVSRGPSAKDVLIDGIGIIVGGFLGRWIFKGRVLTK